MNGGNNNEKKVLSLLLCGAILLGNALTVVADTGVSSTMAWSVYASGSGLVDGSTEGIYYNLTGTHMTMTVSSLSGAGTKIVELRRKAGILSYGYGTNDIDLVQSYGWSPTTSSTQYYFIAYGGNASTSQKIVSKIHNH